MLTLPVEEINCWLFGISPKKVKAEVEPKLREFQKYCFRALYEAVSGNANAEVVALLKSQIELLSEQLRTAHASIAALQEQNQRLLEAVEYHQEQAEKRFQNLEAAHGLDISHAARKLRYIQLVH